MFDGETFARETICRLIDALENKSIGSVNGLIRLDGGKYEEVIFENSIYQRIKNMDGITLWKYKLDIGSSSIEGYSKTLNGARTSSLRILKNRLERNGN